MSNPTEQILLADWTWTGRQFERDVAVHVNETGRITRVGPIEASDQARPTRLKNRALLPGMIDAHSHAFQRALRNRPERFDTGGGGNFWTWRDTMYELVDSLDTDRFYDVCRQCFREMLLAGVTTVGEFHYLHHAGDRDWAFDEAILAAARDAGIRITLIQCYYATGGIGRPLVGAQRRFDSVSVEEFLRHFERLAAKLGSATETLALAAHSIRGASIEDIELLFRRAVEMDLPFHIHVEEQRQEIRDSLAAYGKNPLRVLLDRLPIDAHFTAIHCTHSDAADLRELAQRGGRVCLCPSTEANLADGLPKLRDMRSINLPICIGSDCNLRLSMVEELRWLEFAHRLANETSGIVVNESGDVAPPLFDLATTTGAAALNLPAGRIAAGQWADLCAIDLTHPSLAGHTPESLLHTFIFGSGNEAVSDVWVGGKRLAP